VIISHSIIVRDIEVLSDMYFRSVWFCICPREFSPLIPLHPVAFPCSVMVVDEAHVIKTPNAQKTIAMKNIKAGTYFALTGK
jgi:hypothetical protein